MLNISTKKSLLSPTPINKNDWVQFYYRVPCPFFIQSNSIASSGLIKRNANIHKQGRKKINEFSDKKTSGKSILKQNFPGKKKRCKTAFKQVSQYFFRTNLTVCPSRCLNGSLWMETKSISCFIRRFQRNDNSFTSCQGRFN